MSNTTFITINGVKLEVDQRHARRNDEVCIGSRVKLLTKRAGYGGGPEVFPGIVVGFEPFETLPTIIIAYLDCSYSAVDLKFCHFNAKTTDTEIILAADQAFAINRVNIETWFDRQISRKEIEIQELRDKRGYFQANFVAFWEKAPSPEAGHGG
jgi:hypothetical protein